MATWSRREHVTRRTEWAVPAAPPFGACWSEVVQAIGRAERELRDAGRIPEGREPDDTQIRVLPGDDEIVIYYETKEA
jgi:hypothetical protein